jgi:phosphoribosylcarboxyaminoimidazole (NCAIR) mutase
VSAVGVIMGSDSDWPVMKAAADALDEFEVGYEVGVISAHRTPLRMLDYARTAADRGLRVIIAGAGGAAHLPGMVASATTLPVIGVPVPLKHLDGMDSLLSSAARATRGSWRCGCWPCRTRTCAPGWRTSPGSWRASWSRRTRNCGRSWM